MYVTRSPQSAWWEVASDLEGLEPKAQPRMDLSESLLIKTKGPVDDVCHTEPSVGVVGAEGLEPTTSRM